MGEVSVCTSRTLTLDFLNRNSTTNSGWLTPIPCEAGHADKATRLVGIGIAGIEAPLPCSNNVVTLRSLALGIGMSNGIR